MIYQPKLRGFFVFRSFVCLYQCLRLFCFVFWVNLGKNDYVSLTHFSQRSFVISKAGLEIVVYSMHVTIHLGFGSICKVIQGYTLALK